MGVSSTTEAGVGKCWIKAFQLAVDLHCDHVVGVGVASASAGGLSNLKTLPVIVSVSVAGQNPACCCALSDLMLLAEQLSLGYENCQGRWGTEQGEGGPPVPWGHPVGHRVSRAPALGAPAPHTWCTSCSS